MNSRVTMLRAGALIAFTGGVVGAVNSSLAQLRLRSIDPSTGRYDEARDPAIGANFSVPENGTLTFQGTQDEGDVSAAIRAAAAAYRNAEGDEAKAAAQAKLGELLGKYFDEDMTRREADVKKIEDRLTKLRALLERRLAKKQEIVELQTRVVINEADGLGFFEVAPTMGFNPATGTYYNPAGNLQSWSYGPTTNSDQGPYTVPAPMLANPFAEEPSTSYAAPTGVTRPALEAPAEDQRRESEADPFGPTPAAP